jgi:hypothetical protein
LTLFFSLLCISPPQGICTCIHGRRWALGWHLSDSQMELQRLSIDSFYC